MEEELHKIPVKDLPVIVELLQTLTCNEVAAKWDVSSGMLQAYLAKAGLSSMGIKHKYRREYYISQTALGKSKKEIAYDLGVKYDTFRKMICKAKREGLL